jgi:hypothetical protein
LWHWLNVNGGGNLKIGGSGFELFDRLNRSGRIKNEFSRIVRLTKHTGHHKGWTPCTTGWLAPGVGFAFRVPSPDAALGDGAVATRPAPPFGEFRVFSLKLGHPKGRTPNSKQGRGDSSGFYPPK